MSKFMSKEDKKQILDNMESKCKHKNNEFGDIVLGAMKCNHFHIVYNFDEASLAELETMYYKLKLIINMKITS
jgi:hypothetical protein